MLHRERMHISGLRKAGIQEKRHLIIISLPALRAASPPSCFPGFLISLVLSEASATAGVSTTVTAGLFLAALPQGTSRRNPNPPNAAPLGCATLPAKSRPILPIL